MRVTAIGRTRILIDAIRALDRAEHVVERIVTAQAAEFYDAEVSDFRDLASELDADFRVPNDV